MPIMLYQVRTADWRSDGKITETNGVVVTNGDNELLPINVKGVPISRVSGVLPDVIHSYGSRVIDLVELAQKLPGLDILDLGCGSYERRDQGNIYPPHLCEALYTAGAHVTGVDRPYFEGKHTGEWNFVPLDLRDPTSLGIFHSNSMDVVNMDSFIGHSNPCFTSPALGYLRLDNPFYVALEQHIFTQVIRILRPGGLMVINHDHAYQKSIGPLIFEFLDLIRERVLGISHVDKSSLDFDPRN